MGLETKPNVFIIESNSVENEQWDWSEGRVLRELLRMMDKEVEYRYIRTKKELKEMARQFRRSRFRYLHMACHGRRGTFHLTLDHVPYREYSEIIGPVIGDRRLFLSACDIAHPELARTIYESYRPYSITGPTSDIAFSDAAAVWASLYNLMFKRDSEAIKGEELRDALDDLCGLHEVSFVHFGRRKTPPYFQAYNFDGEEEA